jgi:hypothetical protein
MRTFAIAAILAVTAAAHAETLEDRVHAAAVKACEKDHVDSAPVFFYEGLTKACIAHTTSVAMHKLDAQARAKTMASTASAD